MRPFLGRVLVRTVLAAGAFFLWCIVCFPGWGISRWLSTRPLFAHIIAFQWLLALFAVSLLVLGWFGRWDVPLGRQNALLKSQKGLRLLPVAPPTPPQATTELMPAKALLPRLGFRWKRWGVVGGLLIPTVPLFVVPPAGFASTSVGAGTPVTVVAWNAAGTEHGEAITTLVQQHHPDILVLPEFANPAGGSTLRRALRAAEESPSNYAVFTSAPTGAIAPTTVVVHRRLGNYREVPGVTTTFGAVTLVSEYGPTIVGLHTAPPLPGLLAQWRADLTAIVDFMSTTPHLGIVAGDFNATFRHGGLTTVPQWRDALAAAGWGNGTWPTTLPAWLASPIDHVFVSPRIEISNTVVVEAGDSDHRAIVTRLVIP